MGRSYKADLVEAKKQSKELESLIAELTDRNTTLEEELASAKQESIDNRLAFEQKYSTKESELFSEKQALEVEKGVLKSENDSLKNTITEKQGEINKMQVKKMASEYGNQEDAYLEDTIKWSKYLLLSALVLFLSTFWSVIFASGKAWYERFEFYLIDFILISAVWFCAWQYSYYVKLRNDYANRKTLAQTYHNILLSIGESEDPNENVINIETKKEFMKKATDVLCAPSIIEAKEPLLSKELLKNAGKTAEVIIKMK